ncbi:Inositol-1,4,5-trisphosphate 5-phosphatase 1, partial [Basidiobolus ranarum]
MQANIFIRPSPRSIAIWPTQVSHRETSHLLIIKLRDLHGSEEAKCSVEMISEDLWDPEGYLRLDCGPVYGCLGLISAYNDILLGFVTKHQMLNEIQPGETIHRVRDIGFLSLANGRYDEMFGNEHYSSDQENISTFQPYHEL